MSTDCLFHLVGNSFQHNALTPSQTEGKEKEREKKREREKEREKERKKREKERKKARERVLFSVGKAPSTCASLTLVITAHSQILGRVAVP